MRLIITEKPSMGRDVAAALGANKKGEGFIAGPGDIITWCVGHLVELDQPEDYDANLKQWRLDLLPIIPDQFKYHAAERTLDQFNVIKILLRREDVTEVVNAADAGREGELIFDLVYKLSGCKKPVQRLWISSLTRDAILEGFKNLKPASEYAGLRDSAHARQQSDWLVGMNATRAQTIVARRSRGYEGVFSLGRVQTPTLALIVERDNEIANFAPKTYYEVFADFHSPNGNYRGIWFGKDGNRFDKKEDAEAIVAKVLDQHGLIEKVEKKASKEKPPLLYDLTTLQRVANTRYSLSAQQTLDVAQSLYEKKFITYPRTSSRHLSSSVNSELRGHVEAANIGPYIPFIRQILADGKLKLTNRHVDDKKVADHHAIIPTNQRINPNAVAPDEKRIYDLIVRRFLAAFFPDAEIERTTITTGVKGEKFLTRGTMVLKAGWREVDPPAKEKKAGPEDEESDDAELPPLKAKEDVDVTNAEAVAKQTKAPPRYSESSLLGAMETAGKKIEDDELRLAMKDSGLGTPATRANIIETLLKREYLARDKKSLTATEKGKMLIKMLAVPLLKSAELTGQWERKLSQMTRGEIEREKFMEEVKAMTRDVVSQIAASKMERGIGPGASSVNTPKIPRPDDALDCPKCKRENRAGFLLEREGSNGRFVVCALGKDVCGYISDAPKNAKQRKALTQTPCPICESAMRLRLPKEKGKTAWLSCVRYPECRGSRSFDEKSNLQEPKPLPETGPPCAECKTPMVKRGPASNGSYFWSCPRWRSDGSGCKAKPVWINEARV
jgi:DNA topoisomerase-3